MIYWYGKYYPLITSPYNGSVLGYLLDGILLHSMPKGTKVRGHITTEDGVVIVLGRDMRIVAALLLVAAIVLTIVLWPRYEYVYFQVTYAEKPWMENGVLYCNVVNETDIDVTVQFLNATSKTAIYTLEPGDTLPYISIDFTPTTIRYNGEFDFLLEVQND